MGRARRGAAARLSHSHRVRDSDRRADGSAAAAVCSAGLLEVRRVTITLPIRRFAPQLVEWLRRGSISVTDGLTVSVPTPQIDSGDDGLVVTFGAGGVVATIDRTEATARLCDLLRHGRVSIAPTIDLVVPDPLGFDADPLGTDAVRLTWPAGRKPRVDSPLPGWLDPYVESITVRPDGATVSVTRGPDVEVQFA